MAEAITVIGRYEAMRTINAIVVRLEHPEAAAPGVWDLLEEEYEGRFDDWYPYLYETGATRDAWTDSNAYGALRGFHAGGIEFGSKLPYNRFFARDLLEADAATEEKITAALGYYFVPPDQDEPKPSWWRPRDPRTGQFQKTR